MTMKSLLIGGAILLLLGCVLPAMADTIVPIDPQVIINDPPPSCGSVNPAGLFFSFNSGPTGSNKTDFCNTSGVDWTSLTLASSNTRADGQGFYVPPESNPNDFLKCDTNAFDTCTISLVNGLLEFYLSGIAPNEENQSIHGIHKGEVFSISLKPSQGAAWAPFQEFGGCANASTCAPPPVPEPATITLLGAGLLASAGWRRRRGPR